MILLPYTLIYFIELYLERKQTTRLLLNFKGILQYLISAPLTFIILHDFWVSEKIKISIIFLDTEWSDECIDYTIMCFLLCLSTPLKYFSCSDNQF